MYYKLKSSFLEDTLNDVLDEDGFDISLDGSGSLETNSSGLSDLMDAHSVSAIDSLSGLYSTAGDPVAQPRDSLETPSSSFSNVAEIAPIALTNLRNIDDDHVLRHFDADPGAIETADADMPIAKLNAQAWGDHLNRADTSSSSSSAFGASSKRKFQHSSSQEVVRKVVTEKLFRNASFSKRNPRKSLSRNSSQPNGLGAGGSSGELSARELLPDLETILMEKAKKQQEMEDAQLAQAEPKSVQTGTSAVPVTTLRTVVDQGWLERCSAANGLAGGSKRSVRTK